MWRTASPPRVPNGSASLIRSFWRMRRGTRYVAIAGLISVSPMASRAILVAAAT